MTWQIIQGDCLRVLPTLERESFEAIITDPPYSSGGAFRGDRMGPTSGKYSVRHRGKEYTDFAGDNRDQRSWSYWCTMWLRECLELLITGGIVACFVDWRQLPTLSDALQAAGFVWRGILPWDKTEAARPDKGRFRNQCEYILWASRGAIVAGDGAPCLPGVIRCRVDSGKKQHVAQKPIDVMRMLAQIAWRGGSILDPFCGAGSTGVAAIELGRDFTGIELLEEYSTLSSQRIGEAALQVRLKLEAPVPEQRKMDL